MIVSIITRRIVTLTIRYIRIYIVIYYIYTNIYIIYYNQNNLVITLISRQLTQAMDPGLLGALGALLSGANREGDGGPGGGPGMGSIAILTVPGRGIVGTAITPNGPGKKGFFMVSSCEIRWFLAPEI